MRKLMYYRGWEVDCYYNEEEEYFMLPVNSEDLEFETWEDVVGYIDGQLDVEEIY